jgi:hypothetical protein
MLSEAEVACEWMLWHARSQHLWKTADYLTQLNRVREEGQWKQAEYTSMGATERLLTGNV